MTLFSWVKQFFQRDDDTAYHLYGAVVAQARQKPFYTDFGVPDTVDGRFETIILHAFLVFRRLEEFGEAGHQLAQNTFDVMFCDMDQSLREMGVGDLSVPKKIKTMAKAFYGRVAVYSEALDNDDNQELKDALQLNFFPEGPEYDKHVDLMTEYCLSTHKCLKSLTFKDIESAQIKFPLLEEVLKTTR